MNLSRGLSMISLTLLIVLATTSVFAGVPLVTSYQGRLLDGADQPLTGSYTMIFQIYDVPVGGVPLWTEDHVGVSVTDGLFSVALGSTVPLSAELLDGSGGGGGGAGGFRYLQIQVAGQPAISPRTPLLSAPTAVVAGGVYSEATSGSARSKGIVKARPVTNPPATGARLWLDTDSDDDGHPDYVITDSVSTDGASRLIGHDLNDDGVPDVVVAISTSPTGVSHKLVWDSNADGIANSWKDDDCDGISARGVLGGRSGSTTGTIRMVATPDSAVSALETDSDGDGILEGSVISSSSATSSKHAINTKGTGGNKVVRHFTNALITESAVAADLDGDGLEDNIVSSSADATGSRLAIKTKGTGAQREIRHNTDSLIAESSVESDLDGDGLADMSVVSTTDAMSAKHAINTKGTGGNKVVRHFTNALITESSVAADLDGDGLDDLVVVSSTDATSAKHAINTKGTGAQAGKSASLTMQATPGGNASMAGELDSDGDGIPDKEISQLLTPTTSSMAIKTKGTGADRDRIASISSTTGFLLAGTASVVDDDGDGVPESEISHSVTPTTSSMAIKVKGTGADKDRVISSTTDTAKAVTVHSADIDGDGVADRVIREQCDDDDASITVARGSSEIKIKHKGWDGTIKGRMAIEEGGAIQVDFAGDGVGFVSQRFGVGVLSPTHPVEHSSGAHLTAGGVWTNASDENLKENFQPVDGQELLEKIAELPISQWNYKSESDEVKHIGPTAQDFLTVFGVGSDGKSISTIDPAGIALAAAKELSTRLNDKTKRIDQLEGEIQQLRALVNKLLSEKK